ncbi:MAG: hypothetical protein HOV80_11710 [Polyangiaceae bacterium]|nr:hypothetical protein [Polyangiaceae bacterium]
MNGSRVLWVGVALLGWGCSACAGNKPKDQGPVQDRDPVDVTPPDLPATSAPTTQPSAPPNDASAPVGTWVSASCGQRTYPREITLAKDGSFTARDLVSPCPPDKMCVWSGIVNREGKWAMKESTVIFTVGTGADNKAGQAFPAQIPFTNGVLTEDGGCAYQKK